jgi:hypothetical protein
MSPMMRFAVACLILLVSGCAEQWTRPGSDQTDFARVKELCDTRGSNRYPPRMAEETVLSGGGGCSGSQHCGTPTNVTTVTVDTNREAREKESRICLEQNGWTRSR